MRKFLAVALVLAGLSAACGGDDAGSTIRADGSSTVGPLTELAAELFQQENPDVQVTVGTSGTSGGFEKFCNGETDISNASRPIKQEEIDACGANGIEYEEVQVANDALSAVVNPQNPLQCVSIDQLKQMWDLGSTVDSWGDVTGLGENIPDEKITLFGPGSDSGTFDYWTAEVNGEEGRMRTDYNSIGEDDNAAIQGVSGDPWALAYIPYSFVAEAAGQVKALNIQNPENGECVEPTLENVQNGRYAPLGRPLFIYPSGAALERPEVLSFIEFYIDNQAKITTEATYVPMTDEQVAAARAKVESLVSG